MTSIEEHPSGEPNPLRALTLEQLRRRTSMKWRTYPADVLPLWVAEMDVPLAAPVVRAVTEAVELGDTGYPVGTAYAEALATFAGKRWGWDDLAVERTAIVPDVMLGVVEMLKLVTGPGDPVIVNPPVYPPFHAFVSHMDRRVVEAPLGADLRIDLGVLEEEFRRAVAGAGRAAYLLCSPHNPTGTVHTAEELAAVAALAERYGVRVVADEIHAPVVTGPGARFVPYLSVPGAERVVEAPLGADLRIDLGVLEEEFRRAVAGAGRAAYLLCSPHNPTGTVHTAEELAAVAALAERYGVRVVADEIHAPVVTGPGARFVPYLSVPGAERGLALMSASKGWNLAGLKAALALAGPGAAADLARMPEEVGHGPSHVGVLAHTAALRDGTAWLDAVLAGIEENRRLLTRLLAEHLPGVVHRSGEATYLAWLDCRTLGLGDDPADVFLRRGRVALSSGIPFGTGGVGHLRLNLATSAEVITEAVRRMAAALD